LRFATALTETVPDAKASMQLRCLAADG